MLVIAEYYVNKHNQEQLWFQLVLCQLKKSTALWVIWTKNRQILIQFLHVYGSCTANILHTLEDARHNLTKTIFELLFSEI